jgi:DNA polymerase-3 subunit epsilon
MNVENVLIIDTETTGLHPDKGAELIELALVLFNVKSKTVLQTFSTLLPVADNPVQDINGIDPLVTQSTYYLNCLQDQINLMAQAASAFVAHNAQFDELFFNILECELEFNIPWICTKNHFTWPVPLPRKRLQDICEAMGVPYNNAHRALNDCNFIVSCFSKIEDLQERINDAYKKVIQINN